MWNNLTVDEQDIFFKCKVSAETTFVLLNAHDIATEKLTLEEVCLRVKKLNPRIKYTQQTIRETLENCRAAEANWQELENGEGRALKLKYRVLNRNFYFEWLLREHNFDKAFVAGALYSLTENLFKQTVVYRSVIMKKDLEIEQFKIEGAVLRRSTVHTKAFDFVKFDKEMRNNSADEAKDDKEVLPVSAAQTTPKICPRKRKRQWLLKKQKQAKLNLANRKQKLIYESQSLSQSSADATELELENDEEINSTNCDARLVLEEQFLRKEQQNLSVVGDAKIKHEPAVLDAASTNKLEESSVDKILREFNEHYNITFISKYSNSNNNVASTSKECETRTVPRVAQLKDLSESDETI